MIDDREDIDLSNYCSAIANISNTYVKFGDLFSVQKQHFPGALLSYVNFTHEPLDENSCRIILQENMDHFRFTVPERWADYYEICEAYKEVKRITNTHNAPKNLNDVFSPVKLLVAYSNRPIKAAISYEAVYPQYVILALPKPNLPLGWVYIATAVLNSPVGLAIYHDRFSSTDVSKNGLLEMPIAHVNASKEALSLVADLSYRITTLYEAEKDYHESWEQIDEMKEYLSFSIPQILQLEERQSEELIKGIKTLKPWGLADSNQMTWAEMETRLPKPEFKTWLLGDNSERLYNLEEKRKQQSLLDTEIEELNKLKQLQLWQERVNTGIPNVNISGISFESIEDNNQVEETPSEDSSNRLIEENLDGSIYRYLPLGNYVVAAPNICGGRPTFKYTRIDARHIVYAFLRGETIEEIVQNYRGQLHIDAIEEAVRLALIEGMDYFEETQIVR